MNKKIAYWTFALAISGLLFSSLSQGLNTASYTLSASGTIMPASSTTSIKLKNMIVIYGRTSLNDTEISYIANNFDLLVTEFWEQGGIALSSATLQSIKTLNPNMQIFGYFDSIFVKSDQYLVWQAVNSHEDWFQHNTTENRVVDASWGTYFMNISSVGWQQYYVTWVNSRLNDPNNALFTGLFADDVWGYLSLQVNSYGRFPNNVIPSSTITNWHSNMVGFLHYIKDNIVSGKKVLINTEEFLSNTHDYIDIVDGMMAEALYHANWLPLSNMYDNIPYYTDEVVTASATGKIFVSLNGADVPLNANAATLAELSKNVKFTYAATLLAVNGSNCYFGYSSTLFYTYESGVYGAINLGANLGLPTEGYYKDQNVYMRHFTNGIVVVNPSYTGNSYNINLEGDYQLANGTIITNIVIAPWSGEILYLASQ